LKECVYVVWTFDEEDVVLCFDVVEAGDALCMLRMLECAVLRYWRQNECVLYSMS
jgi:hypothetical protein